MCESEGDKQADQDQAVVACDSECLFSLTAWKHQRGTVYHIKAM